MKPIKYGKMKLNVSSLIITSFNLVLSALILLKIYETDSDKSVVLNIYFIFLIIFNLILWILGRFFIKNASEILKINLIILFTGLFIGVYLCVY